MEVDCDANGCLQDIHWSMGAFGYFPTYSLGNLNASHLVAAARARAESLATDMDRGEFGSLLRWMRENIHQPGKTFEPAELVEKASGSPISHHAHIEHLRSRYL